jgi:hypothetical protein
MPKVLKAYDNDYKISVIDGGTITLDTGANQGAVVITGDLQIDGNSTTVNSTDLQIDDNIIVVSSQADADESEKTAGVPFIFGGKAGLEVDRGSLVDARWIYDESVTWQLGAFPGTGTFYAEQGNQKLPINTPGIVAQGDLYVDTGAGVISVTNTNNYEERIFNYENQKITPDSNGFVIKDNDSIPNTKALVDYFDYTFENIIRPKISEGDTAVETIDEIHPLLDIVSINDEGTNTTVVQTAGRHGFSETDIVNIFGIDANGDPIESLNGNNIQIVEVINPNLIRLNATVGGGNVSNYIQNSGTITKSIFEETRVKITVQGVNNADFYSNRINLEELEIQGTEIATTASNQTLSLKSSGEGVVKVDDVLEITAIPYDEDLTNPPVAPGEGIRLYSAQSGPGTTGLYYVNKDTINDEIVSKNRSLLFSMLF